MEILQDALATSSAETLAILIQQSVSSALHGHLSNERRLSQETRDWFIEYFESSGSHAVVESLGIRGRHKARKVRTAGLDCPYHDRIAAVLREPALWATRESKRIHFEWVWDQQRVWVVQADVVSVTRAGKTPTQIPSVPKRVPRSCRAMISSNFGSRRSSVSWSPLTST